MSGGLAVFASDLRQNRVGKNAELTFGKRPPCFGNNAVLLHQRQGVLLLEEGVKLYLINGGDHIHRFAQVSQPGGVEIAYADGPERTVPVCFLHGAIGPHIITNGLVNKVQIQIIQAQVVQRTLNRCLRPLIAGVLHPQLCGDEQFLTGNVAFLQSSAYRLFVHIGGGGINQTITGTDSIQHRLLTLGRVGNLKDTEALQGHLYAIVQSDIVHSGEPP